MNRHREGSVPAALCMVIGLAIAFWLLWHVGALQRLGDSLAEPASCGSEE